MKIVYSVSTARRAAAWSTILIVVACTACLLAQELSLLKAVQKNFNARAGFQVKYTLKQAGKVLNSGEYYYKKPDKSRIESGLFIILSDGKATWNINKSSRKVVISHLNQNDITIGSLASFVNLYPLKCDVTEIRGPESDNILLKPKSSELPFRMAKCRITRENLISEIEVTDRSGMVYQINLLEYKTGKVPEDRMFVYKQQEGDRVIDLR